MTGLGHASDHNLLDEIAWRAADTPSKAYGLVKAILHKRYEKAVENHRAIVDAMDRLVGQTPRPLLEVWAGALIEAAEKLAAIQAATLRERVHTVERHVVSFRAEIAATQTDLDRLAAQLLMTAPQVPRGASVDSGRIYAGIVRASRARLPGSDALKNVVRCAGGAVSAFLDRQSFELGAGLTELEGAIRRRLSDEAARLAKASAAVQAVDATATLRRGFVLPLDAQRRIIRSAEVARCVASFELLTDGTVACRPVASHQATH